MAVAAIFNFEDVLPFLYVLVIAKLGGNTATLYPNTSIILKCVATTLQDGGRHHLEFLKTVANSSLVDHSSSSVVKIWRLQYKMHPLHWKCIATKMQDDRGCFFSNIRLVVTNICGTTVVTWFRRHLWHQKCMLTGNSRWRLPPSDWMTEKRLST